MKTPRAAEEDDKPRPTPTPTFPETWPGRTKYAYTQDPTDPEFLGAGTYGTVLAAVAVRDGRRVAIKRVAGVFDSKGAVTLARREIRLNRRMSALSAAGASPPVVRMLEAMLDEDDGSLYLVFERMDKTLAKLVSKRLPYEDAIRVARELVRCTAEMHAAGVVHRDLKPQNILASADGSRIAICDLGMARLFDGRSSSDVEGWTDYVTTRWYRAPEVICRCRPPAPSDACCREDRNEANAMHADMWSIGCVIAELLYGEPILPGSSERSQLNHITEALGRMDDETASWYERRASARRNARCLLDAASGTRTSSRIASRIASRLASRLAKRRCDDDAIDLVSRLVDYMPGRRLTAREALRHRAFASVSSASLDDLDAIEEEAPVEAGDLRACDDAFLGDSADALSQTELDEAKAMLLSDIGVTLSRVVVGGKRRRSATVHAGGCKTIRR